VRHSLPGQRRKAIYEGGNQPQAPSALLDLSEPEIPGPGGFWEGAKALKLIGSEPAPLTVQSLCLSMCWP
jgi:hypothetical protein